MAPLPALDEASWETFLSTPVAVLVLGTSTCPACTDWERELTHALERHPGAWESVRFGKIVLDAPGTRWFKRANPWLAEVHELPHNVMYVEGERTKAWPGGGIERLIRRLRRAV